MAIPGTPATNFVEILERLWWKLDRALLWDDVRYSAWSAWWMPSATAARP